MSSRLQASCLSLFVALTVTCIASHSAFAHPQSSAPRPVASHWGLPEARPSGEPTVLYYPSELALHQPTMAAHTRAPFVNVYAIYRRGLPEVLRLRAKEEATPDVTTHHFLLTGQKTAAVWPPATGDVPS